MATSVHRDYMMPIQQEPESWNMAVPQPQSLEKKDNRHKSSQTRIPTFGSLLGVLHELDLVTQWRLLVGIGLSSCCFAEPLSACQVACRSEWLNRLGMLRLTSTFSLRHCCSCVQRTANIRVPHPS